MTVSELIKILKKNGRQKIESGSSHDKWYSTLTETFLWFQDTHQKKLKRVQ